MLTYFQRRTKSVQLVECSRSDRNVFVIRCIECVFGWPEEVSWGRGADAAADDTVLLRRRRR